MAVVARNSTMMCLKDLLIRKTGDEIMLWWLVFFSGNALLVLN